MAIQTKEIVRSLWALSIPVFNIFLMIPAVLYAMTLLVIYAVNIGDPLTSVEAQSVVRGLVKDYWLTVLCSAVLYFPFTKWMRLCRGGEPDKGTDA